MSVTRESAPPRLKYHPDAEVFIFESLHYAQIMLNRQPDPSDSDEQAAAHLTGGELLDAICALGLKRFGMLARFVFAYWGVATTADFGRIVYQLIERKQMSKTEQDRLSDFFDVFELEQALDQAYRIVTDSAFSW